MQKTKILTASLVLAAAAAAQTYTTVPTGFSYDTTYGEGYQYYGTRTTYTRGMQVVRASHMGFTAGTIKEISLRPRKSATANAAMTLDLLMNMGYTNADPNNLPRQFSKIPSKALTNVFKGKVSMPAVTGNSATPQWAVTIKLSSPFLFVKTLGNFVLDMSSTDPTSTGTTSWYQDARRVKFDGTKGSYVTLGAGCNGTNKRAMYTYPYTDTAYPGRTMTVYMYGAPLTVKVAFNFLGFTSTAPFPIDLSALGLTGCKLACSLDLIQAVPAGMASTSYNRYFAQWPIPNDMTLVGAKFATQWFDFDKGANAAGMTLSNARTVTLGKPGTRKYAVQTLYNFVKTEDWGFQPNAYEQGIIFRVTR